MHTCLMTIFLHALHAGVVCVGVLVVIALLAPARTGTNAKRAAVLREAIADGRFMDLTRDRAARELTDEPQLRVGPNPRARVVVALGSWTAAVVHGVVCPEHFREAVRFGLFFAAIAITQLVLGALVLRSAQRRWVIISAVVNVETALLWAFVHSVGLPFGLAEAESIGVLDVVATGAEILAALGALVLLVQPHLGRRPIPAAIWR